MTNLKLCEFCDFQYTDVCPLCVDNEYYDGVDVSHITEDEEIEEVQEAENGNGGTDGQSS